VPADIEKTTFEQIKAMALDHYRANGRRSIDRFEDAAAHLSGFFALARGRDITPDRIMTYMAARREENAANATINRELAALKLMLRLGERASKVTHRPYIGMLEEHNRRKGFFEDDQFQAVLAHLPDDLKPVFEVAFITGWRIKSEILTRQKSPGPAKRLAPPGAWGDEEPRGADVPPGCRGSGPCSKLRAPARRRSRGRPATSSRTYSTASAATGGMISSARWRSARSGGRG
jgi:hypothetical protein